MHVADALGKVVEIIHIPSFRGPPKATRASFGFTDTTFGLGGGTHLVLVVAVLQGTDAQDARHNSAGKHVGNRLHFADGYGIMSFSWPTFGGAAPPAPAS